MGWTFGAPRCVVAGCLLVLGGAGVGFGQIVITEIMYDPIPPSSNSSSAEWFELYNAGNTKVDLDDWVFSDSGTNTFTVNGTLEIEPGAYLVMGRLGSNNGGVTVDYDYPNGFALGNSDDEIIIVDNGGVERDRVEYDENPWPVGDGASIALKSTDDYSTFDNNDPANWCVATTTYGTGARGTPGAANDCPIPPDPVTGSIGLIQGSDLDSPYVGAMATTNDNIVTAVGLGGFFMQAPAPGDGNRNTSDGIFVVHTGSPTVTVGDQVDVVGEVEEYFGFTRIDAKVTGGSVTLDASNQPLPDFVEFDASRPAANPARAHCAMEPECYEGMRIRIASGTVLSGSHYFSSDNVAEMWVRPGVGRAFRDPGVKYPGVRGRPAIPVWDGNPEVIELDPDKLGLDNVSWAPGATFSAAGVLGYEFGDYELWATEQLRERSGGITLPQPVRAKAQGEVTVASLNLFNLRNTPDLRHEKFSLYIREVLGSPDVIGVQEVVSTQAVLDKLAMQISTDDSNVVYTAHVLQTAGNQRSGFLVRSGVTVETGSPTEHGAAETFVDPRDNSVDPVHDRRPLMLQASVGDFAFTVINVHNRSLIGIDEAARGGWIRAKRLAQAQSVARLVQEQNSAGAKVIVVGDFNAYQFTDGYVDAVGQIKGSLKPSRNLLSGPDLVNPNLCNLVDGLPAEDQYSLLFEGTAQALDHALVNRPMSRHAVEMQYGRGNADAAGVERNNSNALAASDHDGFVVYLSTTDRGRSNCPTGLEDGPDDGGQPPPGQPVRLEAPSHLTATAISSTEIELSWRDNSRNETGFEIFFQGPGDSTLRAIESVPANTTSTVVSDLVPGTTYSFAVEAVAGVLRSERTSKATATTWAEADLDITAEGRIVSEGLVRYTVSVRNVGPYDAPNVVIRSSLTAAGGSFQTSTSGCRQDPVGVPRCSRYWVEAGESESFTIDVKIDAARRNSLTYTGTVESDVGREGARVETTLVLGRPAAPSSLQAAALSETEIELRWRDRSDRETGFAVFIQGPGDSKLRMIGTVPANTTSMVVNELVPSVTYRFAVEALNGVLRSRRTPKSTAATWMADAARCGEHDALCFGAFQVEVEWDDGNGRTGRGFAERLTADAGDFWFFHPANIELVVKVLDGCAVNDHYWVYAAGLTDVGVSMTVRDLRSGVEKSWTNPLGTRFRPITDAEAFAVCESGSSASSGSRVVLSGAPRGRAGELYAAAMGAADGIDSASSACAAGDAALCLLGSRFGVRADWEAGERRGSATGFPRTADTGMFWFFSPDNVELVVKVLDGCQQNGYRWVLMGGLTDVGVEVTVTDSESGKAKMYRSPEGTPFAPMFDVTAFACEAGQ